MPSRHEESYSKVVRELQDRPLSPSQKKVEFNDNKLGNLLDEIKTTVTRTADHINAANASKSHDDQFLSPLNSTKTVEEHLSSPKGNNRKIYKSSRYEYSSPSSGAHDAGNVPQPKSYESVEPANINQLDNLLDDLKQQRDYSFDKDAGIDPELLGPGSHVTKTTRTVTSNGVKPVNWSNNPNYQDPVSSQRIHNIKIDTEPRDTLPNTRNIPISRDTLPGPDSKVTTTMKSVSYDVPENANVPANKNYTYKKEFFNSEKTSRTYYPDRDVPPPTKTTIYSNESHKQTENVFPSNITPETVGPNQTYFYKKEVNETKNNIYGPPRSSPPPPINTTTSLYESNVSNTRNVYHPPGGIPVYPSTNANLPPHQPGTKQTYMYKKETTNTTNTAYEPPNGREYLSHDRYVVDAPPSPPPSQPITNKYYKYSSQTTTNTHSRPREREPMVTPFPTDGIQQPTQVDGPPKHLGQLLASFEQDTVHVDDEPYVPRKEVNTALASPTKNVAGPSVYYPPGKELFAKSEAQAAWRGKGGYAKGSGKYEYEAESKSKKGSKSGAAVVPVCLPLCCAMPCTIM